MESFLEIVSIIIGRYVFGGIGYIVRKGWFKLGENINKESAVETGTGDGIDIDDFKNRLVGFACISIFIISIMLLRSYL